MLWGNRKVIFKENRRVLLEGFEQRVPEVDQVSKMEVLYFYPRKTIQTHRFILPKCWKNAKKLFAFLPFIECYSVTSSHTFRLDNQSAASLVPLQPMRSQLDRNPMLCYENTMTALFDDPDQTKRVRILQG